MLYSLNGRLIYANQIPEGVSEIEMTGFSQGVYVLRFSSSTEPDNSTLFTVAR